MKKSQKRSLKDNSVHVERKAIYSSYQIPTFKNPPSMPLVKPAKTKEKVKEHA